jgi:hypothetical protein
MRKWQDLAPPDDPGSYHSVDGVWPTNRGTYESADFQTGLQYGAAGARNPIYAFSANTVSGSVEFMIDGAFIWQWNFGLTDRTGGVTVGGEPMMAQYGNVTVCAMGSANPTVAANGGNFAAIAGAPKAEIVVCQSNCVLVFNTDSGADGWAASDVGDYTNYTTGEAASGRLLATQGPITAAVAFADYVLVFKKNSVYRMRYVGGLVKWSSELISATVGCRDSSDIMLSKYYACAGATGVLFSAFYDLKPQARATSYIFFYDGINQPRRVNPYTRVFEGFMGYDGLNDRFWLWSQNGNFPGVRFYCPASDMWGQLTTPIAGVTASSLAAVMGDPYSRTSRSGTPEAWGLSGGVQTRYSHGTPASDVSGTSYVETAMLGIPTYKTNFTGAVPHLVSRRTTIGTPAAACTWSTFRELQDTSSQAIATVSESSQRAKFDFVATDNFLRAKVSYTNIAVEIEDVEVLNGGIGKAGV